MDETAPQIKLAIIGGGFSAAALIAHLCRHQPEMSRYITVIGSELKHKPLGAGAAFGTESEHFRLNVRSDIMKLFSDKSDDFGSWAQKAVSDDDAHITYGQLEAQKEDYFYRRRDFARYVTVRLNEICSSGLPQQIADRVTSLIPHAACWEIQTQAGASMRAEHVVLAAGNPPPRWPCSVPASPQPTGQLIENPWSGSWLQKIETQASCCFVGGGLTALDGIYALFKKQHQGQIKLVTPQGLTPPVQAPWQAHPASSWPSHITTAGAFVHHMRSSLAAVSQDWQSISWQEQFERLRGQLNQSWRRLNGDEKTRLMRRAGKYWNLARYRAAPQNIHALKQMQQRGQLQIIPGRVLQIQNASQAYQLTLSDASTAPISADWVINCSGTAKDPLTTQLISQGVIRACAFGTGPECSDAFEVLDAKGMAYPHCFALGAMTKGSFGDVVGAGTIARQAEQLAPILAARLSL